MTRVIHIAFTVIVLNFSSSGIAVIESSSFTDGSQTKNLADWQRLALKNEEFSVLTPVQPSMLVQPAGKTFSEGGEKVLGYRAYSGYADGFVFVVESYRASRPQRLLADLNQILEGVIALEPISLNGFSGRRYRSNVKSFSRQVYHFVTANHLYIVTLAAKESNHPSMARFISSLSLGNNDPSAGILPKREDDSITSNADTQNALTSKETTTKAILVWRPAPSYTERARTNQKMGTVILMGIFTADGQVDIVKVEKSLSDGLTEKAIEAAKNIRFFPAQKDGQTISLRIRLEYNFNLY